MYWTLIDRFAHYQNDAVKHGDHAKHIEVEFMVYLTGTFMRLLLTLRTELR
jgi:creatinine amidohydrolase/Fe(II)-dependent formamide hydrolase-like protein